MFFYKFNIGDYASHTRHLSIIEDIAYRRLLDLAYTSEKPIKNDIREISRLINMRDYQPEIIDVLSEFWELLSEEGWINNRVLKEIEDTGHKSVKASESAKMRWDKKRNADLIRMQCVNDANALNDDANAIKNDATRDTRHETRDTEKDKPKRKRSAVCNIQTFLDQCKESGEERIPKDDPVFDFAEKTNIQMDMVRVCWQNFVRTNRESGKRQKDWRATFRNCVRGNWYKFWFIEADGSVKETSQYRAMKTDLGDSNVQ
jgi:uncharacterized protein YdaU (DUF1376 family)